jgi:hypothetical protein
MSSRDQRVMLTAYCSNVSRMCGLRVAWTKLLWIVREEEAVGNELRRIKLGMSDI